MKLKPKLKRLYKSLTAAGLAASTTLSSVMPAMAKVPSVYYTLDPVKYSWSAEGEAKANGAGVEPTGLQFDGYDFYSCSEDHSWNSLGGARTLTVKSGETVNEEYKFLAGRQTYCTGQHETTTSLLAGSQAFVDKTYRYTDDQSVLFPYAKKSSAKTPSFLHRNVVALKWNVVFSVVKCSFCLQLHSHPP